MSTMTNREKIKFLRRYRINELAIERTQDELERLRSVAERCTASITGETSKGVSGDRIQATVERMEYWERRLSAQVWNALRLREEIESAIESVKDDRLRLLLRYRYVDGLTWERTAEKLRVNVRTAYRMHGTTLNLINVIECH